MFHFPPCASNFVTGNQTFKKYQICYTLLTVFTVLPFFLPTTNLMRRRKVGELAGRLALQLVHRLELAPLFGLVQKAAIQAQVLFGGDGGERDGVVNGEDSGLGVVREALAVGRDVDVEDVGGFVRLMGRIGRVGRLVLRGYG